MDDRDTVAEATMASDSLGLTAPFLNIPVNRATGTHSQKQLVLKVWAGEPQRSVKLFWRVQMSTYLMMSNAAFHMSLNGVSIKLLALSADYYF